MKIFEVTTILNEVPAMSIRQDSKKPGDRNTLRFDPRRGTEPIFGQEISFFAGKPLESMAALHSDPEFQSGGSKNVNLTWAPHEDVSTFDTLEQVTAAANKAKELLGAPIYWVNQSDRDAKPEKFKAIAITPIRTEDGKAKYIGKYMTTSINVARDTGNGDYAHPGTNKNLAQFDANDLGVFGYASNNKQSSVNKALADPDDILTFGGRDSSLKPAPQDNGKVPGVLKNPSKYQAPDAIIAEVAEKFGADSPFVTMAREAAQGINPITVTVAKNNRLLNVPEDKLLSELNAIARDYAELLHPLSIVGGAFKSQLGDMSDCEIAYTSTTGELYDGSLRTPDGTIIGVSSKKADSDKDTAAAGNSTSTGALAKRLKNNLQLQDKYPEASKALLDILDNPAEPEPGRIGPFVAASNYISKADAEYVANVLGANHNIKKQKLSDYSPEQLAELESRPTLKKLIDAGPANRLKDKYPFYSVVKYVMDQFCKEMNSKGEMSDLLYELVADANTIFVVTGPSVEASDDSLTYRMKFTLKDPRKEKMKFNLTTSPNYTAEKIDGVKLQFVIGPAPKENESSGPSVDEVAKTVEKETGTKIPAVKKPKADTTSAAPPVATTPTAQAPVATQPAKVKYSPAEQQHIATTYQSLLANPVFKKAYYMNGLNLTQQRAVDAKKAEIVTKLAAGETPEKLAQDYLGYSGGMAKESKELDRIKQLIKYY